VDSNRTTVRVWGGADWAAAVSTLPLRVLNVRLPFQVVKYFCRRSIPDFRRLDAVSTSQVEPLVCEDRIGHASRGQLFIERARTQADMSVGGCPSTAGSGRFPIELSL